MKKTIPFLLIALIGALIGWFTLLPGLDLFLEKTKDIRKPGVIYNGSWGSSLDFGGPKASALIRALVAMTGLGANSSDEAVYWIAMHDETGKRLRGGQTYEVRFARVPLIHQTAGFWSLCVYNSRDYFVPNSLKRFSLGDRSPLHKNGDGSFTIFVSPKPPKDTDNWLPSPEGGEPIVLALRMYAPLPEVLKDPAHSPMPQIIQVH
ncbi:MAG: DUF1214 domain-containing protein [Syntrophales bacterium]